MSQFTHRVPRPLQNEDKWFKFFTPKQLGVAVVAIVIAVISVVMLTNIIGLLPATLINIPFLIFVGAGMFCKPNSSWYLTGGTYPLGIILIRMLIRKMKNVLYVKHLNDGDGGRRW